MPLEVGSRLGHYDVTAVIGEGGMGQVYQATDTKLNRQVALKILPEAFAADPDRLARFQREAQVLASLNHPNIAAIYGLEEADDTRGSPSCFWTPFQERGVSLSPDGRWVAYVSDESGRDEVYVRPYPGPGGQVIISTGGGEEVVWGPNGSELFYRNGVQVMVVKVNTAQTFAADVPVPLFVAPYALDNAGGGAGGNPNYDVSPDGEFIFVEQDSPSGVEGVSQINVVLNWAEELKRLVPVD